MLSPKSVLSNVRQELMKTLDENLAKGRLLSIFIPPNLFGNIIEDVLADYRKAGWEVEWKPRGTSEKVVVSFKFPKTNVAPTQEWLTKMGNLEDKCPSVACGVVPRSHPKPIITADIIVVHNGKILLIERGKDPFKGCYALPGGHFDIDTDASIKDCAVRELGEETCIYLPKNSLAFVDYFDKKGRDSRGRYVGFCWAVNVDFDMTFKAKAGDDAKSLTWFEFENLPKLAFDHKEMIETWKKLEKI